jgi:hypothetical protein
MIITAIAIITAAITGYVAGCWHCTSTERRQIRDLLHQLDEHAAEYWRQEETK